MAQLLQEIIGAAKAGDRQAKERLADCIDRFVRLFSGGLSGQVRRTCGSTIDFVSEGLAEALARIEEFQYRSDEEFYGWVARLIRSRMVDALRHEHRKKRAGNPVALDEAIHPARAPGPTPSQLISVQELREVLRSLVLELQLEHPEEMEAVLLKVFEGESWPGIRQCMGLSSEKRARTLCARGLDLLRPRVEQAVGSDLFEEFLGL